MTKAARTRLATLLLLAAAGVLIVARQTAWKFDFQGVGAEFATTTNRAADPRDTIYRMLDAARDGDVETYLSCYAVNVANRLRHSRNETTAEDFAVYLAERNRAIKGVAVSEPEPLSPDQVRVRVEYVYEDRNEAQQLHLEQDGAAWRISRVDAAVHVETPTPYGTPVD